MVVLEGSTDEQLLQETLDADRRCWYLPPTPQGVPN